MFKTDKKSLERLSFEFNERDIANFKSILERLKSQQLFTIDETEIQKALDGLNEIGKLKLNKKIYAFHVDDAYSRMQGGMSEGVELYQRQGDRLKDFFIPATREGVYQVDDAVEFLKSEKIKIIYTGQIPVGGEFLGISQKCDEDDPIKTDILRGYEIEEFESAGIKVISLDSLI